MKNLKEITKEYLQVVEVRRKFLNFLLSGYILDEYSMKKISFLDKREETLRKRRFKIITQQ